MKKIKVLFIFIIILLCGILVFELGLSKTSNNDTIKEFVVQEGDTYFTIASRLKDNKLIKSELFYKIYVKIKNPNQLETGKYELKENMSTKKIISIFNQGSNNNVDAITITFKEGKNMRQIANIISENTNNSYDSVFELLKDQTYIDELVNKYWFLTNDIKNTNIYYPLEGYLFPDTYEFLNKDVSVKTIFETLLNEMNKKLEPFKQDIENSKYTVHQILTLASIVELEGASSNDRKDVAGVFYNRINYNWTLGSDVTGYYGAKMDDWSNGLGSHVNDCNSYNTRGTCVVGLPVGPICNPGIASLEATIKPNTHKYFYFVADCQGKTYLNYTETEHINTIRKLKQENNWCDN